MMKTCNGLGVPDDVIQAERTLSKWAAENNLKQWKIGCAQSRVDGWQPIETAPKDGTMFLCWVKAVRYGEDDEGNPREEDCSQVEFCAWYMLEQSPDGGYYDSFCGQIGDHQVITHWMPLPPPPKD